MKSQVRLFFEETSIKIFPTIIGGDTSAIFSSATIWVRLYQNHLQTQKSGFYRLSVEKPLRSCRDEEETRDSVISRTRQNCTTQTHKPKTSVQKSTGLKRHRQLLKNIRHWSWEREETWININVPTLLSAIHSERRRPLEVISVSTTVRMKDIWLVINSSSLTQTAFITATQTRTYCTSVRSKRSKMRKKIPFSPPMYCL